MGTTITDFSDSVAIFNYVSKIDNPERLNDCIAHIIELVRTHGHSILVAYLRSLFLVYSLLSCPETKELVSADLGTVEFIIESTLSLVNDTTAAVTLLIQTLGSVPKVACKVPELSVVTSNYIERALLLTQKANYWVSLATASALAKSSDIGTASQAQRLLPTLLSEFSRQKTKLDSKEKHDSSILPFIISNLATINESSSTLPHMSFADQLLRAGACASVTEVIENYTKDHSSSDQQTQKATEPNTSTGSRSSILSLDEVAQAMATIASNIGQTGDGKGDSSWNPSDFAKGINQCIPNLSWDDVIYKLPYSNLNVKNEAGPIFIVSVYFAATSGQGRPFPYSFMYEIWPDPQAHVSFLRHALHANAIGHHLVDKHMPVIPPDPLETLYQFYHPEVARIIASPWNSLSLMLVLSHLLDSKARDDVRSLIEYGILQEPILVTLALARLKVQHSRLQALLQHNVTRFLKQEFKQSALFFELFRICEKKGMLSLFCNLQRKDPLLARSILDVLVNLNILNELWHTKNREDVMMLDFVVELSVFASRRGYQVFESCFTGLLSELGNDMLHTSLEVLHNKLQLEAARQRGEDDGATAYSAAEFTTIFKALGVMNLSPNNAANLKALYSQFLELATELERNENEHSHDEGRIEKEAENLFLQLYKGELSVDKMAGLLKDLQDSLIIFKRKIYAHVIEYPLEEFSFFGNYPDKELTITGQLVGKLIQQHTLSPENEPAVLDMVLRALQSSSTSKTFHFGMTVLEVCQERIEQLPVLCSAIYQIPAFRQNTSSGVVQLVTSIINTAAPQRNVASAMDGPNGVSQQASRLLADGNKVRVQDDSPSVLMGGLVFQSVKPPPLPVIDKEYVEPPEDIKDKIQFAVNNLAPNNLEEKTSEVDKILFPEHLVWFSQETIVKRASREPNYHSLYQQFINGLQRPLLMKYIVRETLVSISRLLNSDTTINSSRDRGYLKNLGAWLGGITLAKNQPILREHVSFKALLCEGYKGNRLIVAIPFVCKVLEQTSRSTIFHPPNPWLMSIMGLLSELYMTANLKLNLAFEIEVLCKALNLDVKEIAPTSILDSSSNISSSKDKGNIVDALGARFAQVSVDSAGSGVVAPHTENVVPQQTITTPAAAAAAAAATATTADTIQMPVLSGADISVNILAVLTQHASFQAAESLFAQQPTMSKVFYVLMERMIREIIPIHVGRSIYVAVSCTRDTIQKDFCGEPNEENVHRAAQVMARGLAGALAVSLCREQLKSKLYLTMREFLISHSVPEQSANTIAVGLVADNLDLACAIAEKESIERASQQINLILSESYVTRKRTRERTGQPYYDMATYSQLSYPPDFPELLKVRLNSLQPGHLRIYEGFTQIPHFFSQISSGDPASATGTDSILGPGSIDSNVAGDVVEYPPSGVSADFGGTANAAAAVTATAATASDNLGKFNSAQCFERFAAIISDLDKVISNTDAGVTLSQLPSQHEACLYARDIIILAVRSSTPDDTAMDFAQALVNYLYRSSTKLAIDLYVLLLSRMCEMSARVNKEVTTWLAFADDERKHNVPVTIALLNEQLVSIEDEDGQLGRLIDDGGRASVVEFAARLLRKAILDGAMSVPVNIRSFANTIQAFVRLVQGGRAPSIVTQLLEDIQTAQKQQQPVQPSSSSSSLPATATATATATSVLSNVQDSTAETVPGVADDNNEENGANRAQETVSYQNILLNWTRVYNHPAAGEAELTTLVRQLKQQVHFHKVDTAAAFFRACVEAAILYYEQQASISSRAMLSGEGNSGSVSGADGYQVADALVNLVLYLVKVGGDDSSKIDLQPMRMFLSSTALVLVHTHSTSPGMFGAFQKPFFRLLCGVLHEVNAAYHDENSPWCNEDCLKSIVQLVSETLLLLSPSYVPGFSFVWLMLVSHRHLFPRLMDNKDSWRMAATLLGNQIQFLSPFIESGYLSESLKLLYRGTICVILVVLHDYPGFLANHALYLCNFVPSNCVQLRNLLLSAYPRDMRLPEPLSPNLKIDLLPDVANSPEIAFDHVQELDKKDGLKAGLESYLKGKGSTFIKEAAEKLAIVTIKHGQPQDAMDIATTTALINAFVLHTVVVITSAPEGPSRESAQRLALDMFHELLAKAEPEQAYYLVSAIANQLRFPSSHTYLCSRVVLALFSKADERIRECISRVLIERILVNRPFPWGLLVTLIELLRNPYYAFWSHEFTRHPPQIAELLAAVSKSIHPATADAVTTDSSNK